VRTLTSVIAPSAVDATTPVVIELIVHAPATLSLDVTTAWAT